MAGLVDAQERLLGRLNGSQKPMAALGFVLALLGAAYLAWAFVRFDPLADPREDPGFDWPVARLAFLFERGHERIENTVPATPTEARLLRGLARNLNFSAGVMVLLLRVIVGTLALVMGFAIMTVVVERARLLALIRRLQDPP